MPTLDQISGHLARTYVSVPWWSNTDKVAVYFESFENLQPLVDIINQVLQMEQQMNEALPKAAAAMEWYKIAKLFSEENIMLCPTCSKWKTKDYAGRTQWKAYYEMDSVEQDQVDALREKSGYKFINVVCPACRRKSIYP